MRSFLDVFVLCGVDAPAMMGSGVCVGVRPDVAKGAARDSGLNKEPADITEEQQPSNRSS